jgi:peptidoglycan/xylan/chitin deacetylase (PgdA/CDA1 family)
VSWEVLEEEIARWRDAGRTVEFWWRDDDATAPTPRVRQLLDVAAASGVPLALAVIPLSAEAELFDRISAQVLMHGTDHRNRAGEGEKKTEFPPGDEPLERLARACERLTALAGPAFVPVLAPPWNRFRADLVAALPSIGLRGLSSFGARKGARGVVEVNTHVDIIDWRGTRAICGEAAALAAAARHLAARRTGAVDASEPTGWLTHHELHDGAAWKFLSDLFERTQRLGARWLDAKNIFTPGR